MRVPNTPMQLDFPDSRSSQIDRIIAAELGAVDVRMSDEGGAVALVAETPDRAGLSGFEIGQPLGGQGFGEIGDGIETLDRKAGIAVDDHPFRGCGPGA